MRSMVTRRRRWRRSGLLSSDARALHLLRSDGFDHQLDRLRQPQGPAREFGPVRLWGTIGWIVASWPFIFILVNWSKVPGIGDVGLQSSWLGTALGTSERRRRSVTAQRYIFLVAGIASFVLAAISPSLPHTPPKPATAASSRARCSRRPKLLRHPFVAVLFLVTFIDAAVHQSFFYWTASFLKTVSASRRTGCRR